ncbi:proteophosphoglycan 5 [Planoprotostelium fungivorum]|uniref:Cilia- and flagella-associated protein 300 n=1 Tax=Planoprotostelium fungivorum TaxID=1890364 RepID=A0A2P6N8U8_9EUKA|nr:proteophosphoglycan 5 [Planoprotostelium fungivorum]
MIEEIDQSFSIIGEEENSSRTSIDTKRYLTKWGISPTILRFTSQKRFYMEQAVEFLIDFLNDEVVQDLLERNGIRLGKVNEVSCKKLDATVMNMKFFDRISEQGIARGPDQILSKRQPDYIGGRLCQFEDRLNPYISVTKNLYKNLKKDHHQLVFHLHKGRFRKSQPFVIEDGMDYGKAPRQRRSHATPYDRKQAPKKTNLHQRQVEEREEKEKPSSSFFSQLKDKVFGYGLSWLTYSSGGPQESDDGQDEDDFVEDGEEDNGESYNISTGHESINSSNGLAASTNSLRHSMTLRSPVAKSPNNVPNFNSPAAQQPQAMPPMPPMFPYPVSMTPTGPYSSMMYAVPMAFSSPFVHYTAPQLDSNNRAAPMINFSSGNGAASVSNTSRLSLTSPTPQRQASLSSSLSTTPRITKKRQIDSSPEEGSYHKSKRGRCCDTINYPIITVYRTDPVPVDERVKNAVSQLQAVEQTALTPKTPSRIFATPGRNTAVKRIPGEGPPIASTPNKEISNFSQMAGRSRTVRQPTPYQRAGRPAQRRAPTTEPREEPEEAELVLRKPAMASVDVLAPVRPVVQPSREMTPYRKTSEKETPPSTERKSLIEDHVTQEEPKEKEPVEKPSIFSLPTPTSEPKFGVGSEVRGLFFRMIQEQQAPKISGMEKKSEELPKADKPIFNFGPSFESKKTSETETNPAFEAPKAIFNFSPLPETKPTAETKPVETKRKVDEPILPSTSLPFTSLPSSTTPAAENKPIKFSSFVPKKEEPKGKTIVEDGAEFYDPGDDGDDGSDLDSEEDPPVKKPASSFVPSGSFNFGVGATPIATSDKPMFSFGMAPAASGASSAPFSFGASSAPVGLSLSSDSTEPKKVETPSLFTPAAVDTPSLVSTTTQPKIPAPVFNFGLPSATSSVAAPKLSTPATETKANESMEQESVGAPFGSALGSSTAPAINLGFNFGTSTTPSVPANSTTTGLSSFPASTSFGNTSAPGSSTPTLAASSAPLLGASSTPAFGISSTPAFGSDSTPAFGGASVPTFGAPSTPAFGGATVPAFGAASTPIFGASSAPTFGGASTPAFNGASAPTFGASSTPTFVAAPPAFGAASTPAFGSSQSSTPSMFGSTMTTAAPAFGNGEATPFGGNASTPFAFGGASTPSTFGGPSAFGSSTGPSAFGSATFGASAAPAFGAQTQSSFPFGGETQSTSMFDSTPPASNSFAFNAPTPTPTPNAPFTFNSAAPTPSGYSFGASTPATSTFTFGADSQPAFGGSSFGTPQPAFGGAPQPATFTPAPFNASPFGSPAAFGGENTGGFNIGASSNNSSTKRVFKKGKREDDRRNRSQRLRIFNQRMRSSVTHTPELFRALPWEIVEAIFSHLHWSELIFLLRVSVWFFNLIHNLHNTWRSIEIRMNAGRLKKTDRILSSISQAAGEHLQTLTRLDQSLSDVSCYCINLKTIRLSHIITTPRHLTQLFNYLSIESFSVKEIDITEPKPFSVDCPTLRRLEVNEILFAQDSHLAHSDLSFFDQILLPSGRYLESLSLVNISYHGHLHLDRCTNLRSLHLRAIKLSGTHSLYYNLKCALLHSLTEITLTLDVSTNLLSAQEAVIEARVGCHKLRELNVSLTRYPHLTLLLSQLPHLQILYATYSLLEPQALLCLSEHKSPLRTLHIPLCPRLTEGLELVCQLSHLEELKITWTVSEIAETDTNVGRRGDINHFELISSK